MKNLKISLVCVAIVASFFAGISIRSNFLEDPSIQISHVHDGDTIIVNITNWHPIVGKKMSIRIRGIDTPELNDASKKILAKEAKEFTTKMISYSHVEFKNFTRDKYFRLDADVYVNGKNLGDLLVEHNLAKRYDGGKKPTWK